MADLRFDESMRVHEDVLFAFKFLQLSKSAVVLNTPLYWYISRGNSAMKNFQKSDTEDIRKHYEEVVNFIISKYPGLELEVLKRTMSTLFNLLTVAKKTDDQKELAKVRLEIYHNRIKLKSGSYRISRNHLIKLILSYLPLGLFNFGLWSFRKIRRVA